MNMIKQTTKGNAMKKELLEKIQRTHTMLAEDHRDAEKLGEDNIGMTLQLELLDDLAIAVHGLDEPVLEHIFKS